MIINKIYVFRHFPLPLTYRVAAVYMIPQKHNGLDKK